MNEAVSTFSGTTGLAQPHAAGSRPLSMRLTLSVWAAASIGGWALALLAILPLF